MEASPSTLMTGPPTEAVLWSPALYNQCVALGLYRGGLQRVTQGFKFLGICIHLISIAILLGGKFMLLIGIFALFRSDLVCLTRQILLTISNLKAIGRPVQKLPGRLFKRNFFNLHCRHALWLNNSL